MILNDSMIQAYIYLTRSQLSDSNYSAHFIAEEKGKISKVLDEEENWIMDSSDGATLIELEEKFSKLRVSR